MTRQNPSAIDLQIMWSRLLAVVEEQAQVLIRTAFSPIVRECGDISAGIFNREGLMLAQAVTGTPGHINTMAEAVRLFFAHFPPQTMKPGEVYMTNDPWIASGHLNDFMLVQPVFQREALVGFISCTSHLIDLGGLGMGPEGSDVFDEGLMIPPVKLVENGTVNDLLLTLIKANSREPVQNEGDVYALIACCNVGEARLLDMMAEFGLDDLGALGGYILETSGRAAQAAIRAVPNGVYRNALTLDGYDFEIDLCAALTVEDERLTLDCAGSSPCSRYGINVPLNYATAYAVFGIHCIVAPDIPNNAGSLAPFRVMAPPGCIINAPRPVPVAMRHTVGQMMPDLVFGCLRQALPDRVPAEGASCMYDLPMRNVPLTQASNATPFAVELTHNGGTGARPAQDGLSATAYPSGVWGSQVEITESIAPLLIRRRELLCDSGGPGRQRGGLGQVLEVESIEGAPIALFTSLERVKYPARGAAGGGNGAPGRLQLTSGPVLSGKGEVRIEPGDRLIFETPGGGGFGDPAERDPEALRRDLRQGLVSREAAARDYGHAAGED